MSLKRKVADVDVIESTHLGHENGSDDVSSRVDEKRETEIAKDAKRRAVEIIEDGPSEEAVFNLRILRRHLYIHGRLNPNPAELSKLEECSVHQLCTVSGKYTCMGCRYPVCDHHSSHDFMTDDPDENGMNRACEIKSFLHIIL